LDQILKIFNRINEIHEIEKIFNLVAGPNLASARLENMLYGLTGSWAKWQLDPQH
jgi:hypothetical protein